MKICKAGYEANTIALGHFHGLGNFGEYEIAGVKRTSAVFGGNWDGELRMVDAGGWHSCRFMHSRPRVVGDGGGDVASGATQIAAEGVSGGAFVARAGAPAGKQGEAQVGNREARHFVSDEAVAGEGQLETAAKADAVNRGDGDEWGGVDRVENDVDALEELANAGEAPLIR